MVFTENADVLRPAFPDRAIPLITYGSSFDRLCAKHIPTTLSCSRIYIICSTSLSQNTPALTNLTTALQSANLTVVGTRTGFSPHTRWDQVIACARDARTKSPDCIITLGAGSLTDAAKTICWMLANDASLDSEAGLESMLHTSPTYRTDLKPPTTVRHVAIPTSLSGGEYQSISGMTKSDGSHQKCLFEPPEANPALVVLDADLSTTTPQAIWLSTGIRAVDHCVETLCSLLSNTKGDEEAEKGLRRLVPGLIRCKRDPKDLDARFECMLGVIEAMSAVGSGVPLGASHAIGHQLGPLGVGHGETSCIMLPAVCKWNEKVGANVERQAYTKKMLLEDAVVKELVSRKFGEGGHAEREVDLGDILDLVVRELGMPRTLKDVGVGRDKLEGLARNSLTDHWIKTNAKPITEMEQVMEILEMVVE
jgi:alcohol dehydrogenase class IV